MDSPTRVLVTGYSGFLGRHVVKQLKGEGCEVVQISRGMGFNLLHETDALTAILSARPSVVIHLAAPAKAGNMFGGVSFRDTLKMGMNVLDASALVGAKFVTVTPRSIYSPNLPLLFKNNFKGILESYLDLGKPESAEGEAKQALLNGARRYKAQYGLSSVMLVLPPLYGDSFHTEVGVMMAGIHECRKEPEFCFDEMHAEDMIDHVFVQDAAQAIVRAALNDVKGDFMNVVSPDQMTRGKVAQAISSHVGYTGKIEFTRKEPAPYVPLSGELSKSLLKWTPETKIMNGLTEVLDGLIGPKVIPVPAC